MKHVTRRVISALASLAPVFAAAQTTTITPPAVAVPPASQPGAAAKPLPQSRWTLAQMRESFELADSDSNGELTRAEAEQLSIKPRSFEDMDQNKDGVLERGEYEPLLPR